MKFSLKWIQFINQEDVLMGECRFGDNYKRHKRLKEFPCVLTPLGPVP